MTQTQALTILKTGANVFITGPAGSGKTFVVNEYIKYLKDHEVPIGITASTGIAATHMGGVTIHSWSGMGIKADMNEYDLNSLSEKAYLAKRIKEAHVLIIDEVSMLHHFRLDTVDTIAKHVRKNDKPFGGLQVVLCGDFFQLPPVSRMGEPEAHFIYRSQAWKEARFTVCYLHENYRQTDDGILSILNEIRGGEVSDGSREELRTRYREARTADVSEPVSLGGVIAAEVEPTRLYTHNIDVDSVNETALARVTGTEFTYEMTTKGKKPLVEALKKSCLAPEILRLRKGARVMCVKNNFDKGYVNGTLGVVVSCGPGVDPVIRTASGALVAIERASWKVEDDGRVLAELDQYPLRLAWAITVHKSQGMSLDAVEVDLSKSFEPGMGYVALSRVRTLAGLTILGMNERALQVHPGVLEYDRHLRELSDKAESVLTHTDEKEIVSAQEEFLVKVAPMYAFGEGKNHKGKDGKARASKISTYAKTAKLVQAGKSLKEIAKERDMTAETIISHLEHLILGTDEGATIELSDLAHLKYEISPQHFGKIEKALEEVFEKQKDEKPPLLSPVKTKVGANISFKDIRLARVLLGYFKKGKVSDVAETE